MNIATIASQVGAPPATTVDSAGHVEVIVETATGKTRRVTAATFNSSGQLVLVTGK
jgi:hypothetical protein